MFSQQAVTILASILGAKAAQEAARHTAYMQWLDSITFDVKSTVPLIKRRG